MRHDIDILEQQEIMLSISRRDHFRGYLVSTGVSCNFKISSIEKIISFKLLKMLVMSKIVCNKQVSASVGNNKVSNNV